MNTAVIPTNGVQGDITSCGLETVMISMERDSALSLAEKMTYQTYNVCTKEIIREYTTEGLNFGFIFVATMTCLLGLIIISWFISLFRSYRW